MKQPKALVLFSGGLDSRLAVKILQEQNIEVEAVFFQIPFGGGCCDNKSSIINYCQIQNVKLHIIDIKNPRLFSKYLKIIKSPNHGYGSALNPCKDCKIFMFKQAKKLAKKINANIIATGEVLGQRPNSQIKHQLELTEKKAELENKILRPLSAKLLSETIYEKNKLVDREKLLNIQGRTRKKQIKLAKKYKIKYPNAGGGCLLCEKDYCKKLKDLLEYKPINKIKPQDIELLKIGRRFKNKGIINLGRDQKENQELEALNKKLKYNLLISEVPGPIVIFEKKSDKTLAINIQKAYSKNSKLLREDFEKFKPQ